MREDIDNYIMILCVFREITVPFPLSMYVYLAFHFFFICGSRYGMQILRLQRVDETAEVVEG